MTAPSEISARDSAVGVTEKSWIHLANDYFWNGHPRYGGMTVYVDGRALGRVPQFCTFRFPVTPGNRSLRVRLLWFASVHFPIAAAAGETIRLKGDLVRDLPTAQRVTLMTLRPWRALSLIRVEDDRPSGSP